MGLRFRKRITIMPGVRLNLSGSGVSTSIGPRGLSLTLGRRGTYINAGLPGTGLYYRTRIDNRQSSAAAAGSNPVDYPDTVNIQVDDDGLLRLTDEHDQPLPAKAARQVKTHQAETIQTLLEQAAERINTELNACLGVHLLTPKPGTPPALPAPFAIDEPLPPVIEEPGLMDKLLFRQDSIEQSNQQALASYQQELAQWQQLRDDHEQECAEVEKAFRLAAQGFSAHMETALDYVLSGIAWPKETLIEYEFNHDVTGIALDVDLPDEGDVPQRMAEARGNGKLSFKKRTDAQGRRDFIRLCAGSLFRVTGEVFALFPGIQRCLISGYIQRANPATGVVEDQYVLSVLIQREQWQMLDFDRLEDIDPVATLQACGVRMARDRSSRLKEIEPLARDVLDIG
ncbi:MULTISPECIES: DUF4236 domain-containing protein [unclassified Oceanobacter]|jgi:hypothetical protein|uniref:DUF4236 domain-containing protein n=1 Tax=unclassified Oceanobacter TaxID=2620260 RepID=UPI002733F32E|nr:MULTISPECIES: DUF4236 domain-containing protein [unclassified Oceanobacter]MDP2504510.1 DUF4236 domain-containing protein [Oceanobacter sp. 3_MG-2023]MDP2547036.1 DUF4236 domain-containing protein [Oceanobacter sp. 4_MG-2023]